MEVVVRTKAVIRVLAVMMEVVVRTKAVIRVLAVMMEVAAVVIQIILHLPRLQQTMKPVLMGQHQMLVVSVLQRQIRVGEQLHHLQQQHNRQPVLMDQYQILLVSVPHPLRQHKK